MHAEQLLPARRRPEFETSEEAHHYLWHLHLRGHFPHPVHTVRVCGQCEARPTVTFLSAGHRCRATSTKLCSAMQRIINYRIDPNFRLTCSLPRVSITVRTTDSVAKFTNCEVRPNFHRLLCAGDPPC